MSTTLPEMTERPNTRQMKPAGRSRATLVLIAVVAVLVGLAGGYLLRAATETTSTTAAVSAYAPDKVVHADVYFDGVRAYYNGPTELKAGSTFVVQLTTTVKGASFAVVRLDPPPTWSTLTRDLAGANASTATEPMQYVHPVMSHNATGAVSGVLRVSGLYAIFVGPATPPFGSGSVVAPTMLRVLP